MKNNLFNLITIKKREKNQPLPLWRRITLYFIFAAMAFFVFVMASSYMAGKRLEWEIIRIQKAGEPLTFTNLRPRPVPPATEDAADYYVDAMWEIQPGELSEMAKVNAFYRISLAAQPLNPFPGDLRKTVTQNLSKTQALLAKLDKGAGLELTGFDIGILHGRKVCKNRLDSIQAAFFLLSLRTLDAISTSNSEKAVQSIESTLKLMRLFDSQPTMLVLVSKLTCVRLACSDVLLLLMRCRLSDQQLARIQTILDKLLPDSTLEKTLLAERAYQLEIARYLFSRGFASKYLLAEEPNLPERLQSSRFMWYRMRLRSGSVKYLKDMAWYIEASGRPWPVPLDKITDANSSSSGKSSRLAAALVPLSRLTAETLAAAKCTTTAIAIERYRLQKGNLPDLLDDISPQYIEAVPLDPFTGKPLLYIRDGDLYTVYSAGFNRIDDSGSITPKKQNAVILDSGIRVKKTASK
ncbi:MAG: hypothetical protein JW749_10580 [Sedimentisphaerales bacterium]|nr:hypothetical protein [Sedimentisphaerales bacterium]